MCISSNSVNQAQDLMSVTKIEDFPNSLLPSDYESWNFVSSSILPTSGCSLLKPSWCGVVVSPLLRHTSSSSSVARAAWDTW